jgi:hypothetical protein
MDEERQELRDRVLSLAGVSPSEARPRFATYEKGEAHKRQGGDLLEVNTAFDFSDLVPGAMLVLHELQLVTIDGI